MMRKRIAFATTLLAVIGVIVVSGVLRFDLSALPEPGPTETEIARRIKKSLIARSSQHGIPSKPPSTQTSIAEGQKRFGVECAMCHGLNGRTPTDNGHWMYPRAADPTSPDVQGYSDAELYWIMKNGIRLSGMPGFGKVESDEHLWQLVH